jgi:F0F1-type ATP synthase membrane subunit b/b'
VDLSQFTTPVFIAQAIDFVIFVAAIVWLWIRYGKAALVKSQDAQNKAMDDAVARKSDAEAALARAREAFEHAQRVAVTMVQTAQAQAKESAERDREAAVERASRVAVHASGELERERYRVRRELLEDTVEQAYTKARALIVHELDHAGQHALIDRLIVDLERVRA